jgi:hypothetical protein
LRNTNNRGSSPAAQARLKPVVDDGRNVVAAKGEEPSVRFRIVDTSARARHIDGATDNAIQEPQLQHFLQPETGPTAMLRLRISVIIAVVSHPGFSPPQVSRYRRHDRTTVVRSNQ